MMPSTDSLWSCPLLQGFCFKNRINNCCQSLQSLPWWQEQLQKITKGHDNIARKYKIKCVSESRVSLYPGCICQFQTLAVEFAAPGNYWTERVSISALTVRTVTEHVQSPSCRRASRYIYLWHATRQKHGTEPKIMCDILALHWLFFQMWHVQCFLCGCTTGKLRNSLISWRKHQQSAGFSAAAAQKTCSSTSTDPSTSRL